ncbi:hypothetical protein P4B35_03420 [Pontiellaceae bacterium B12227]|nr:hypothetical protein [Pontiellaceae bacterium B12227]
MSAKTTMCILFRDETVDAVFIDRTVLGAQIKFMERFPRDELVFEEIAKLTKSVEKTPSRVLLCPPRDLVMQRTLIYPALAPADIANMIQFEATRHVPLAEADRTIGWSSIELEEEKKVVLNLVAARNTDIQELIGKFQALEVPIDEAVPFSSAVVPILGKQPTLLVVTDHRHVELCLYGNGLLRDSQTLPADSPDRVLTAARQMAAKNREWLGMEGVGRVLRCGDFQPSENFDADLGAAFGLPVQPLEMPAEFQALEKPLADVLLAASAELPQEMNLIEHSGRKVPMSRKTIITMALCALLAVELVAWTAFKTGAPALQRKQVASEIAKVKRRAAPIQRMKDRNREMRKQLYRLDEICESHVSAMQVLNGLSELLPEDTYLQLAFYKPGTLHFRGRSKEPERITELLMDAPYVEAISKSDIGKKEGDYHSIAITVTTRTSDEEI